jgi:PKD repeat protein
MGKHELKRRYLVPIAIVATAATIHLSCGGGDGDDSATGPSSNAAPSGSFTITPGTVALMATTVLTFAATGSDPDGDPLTYSWDFGDGQVGSGQTVQHSFASAGSLTVTLTIRDNSGATGTSSRTVTVRTLDGEWRDTDTRWRIIIRQSGATFSGEIYFGPFGHISNIESGILTDPRNMTFFRRATHWWAYQDTYSGELDEALDVISARPDNQSCCFFNLTRQ